MSDVARAFVQMLSKSDDVPEHVISGILACRADAVEPLVEALNDRSFDAPSHPSGGLVRAHAAELLGHLGEPAAVEPLLDVIVADRANTRLVKSVAGALAQLHESLDGGIATLALARVKATDDVLARMMLAMVLASAKVQDPAVTELLRDLLPQDPDIVLPLIATYGDADLAPDVARILLDAEGEPQRVMQAIHTLSKLGHRHPKLEALANKADELLRHEVGRELLLSLAPDLANLAR